MADDQLPMKEHPHSIWTLGGIPQKYQGLPSPADLESWGTTWKAASDDYLIGVAARQYGTDTAAALPAMIESQRRLRTAIDTFDERSNASAQRLVDVEERLLKTIETFNTEADKQTSKIIRLTVRIEWLTWVLVAIGVIQIVLMLAKGDA